MSETLTKAEKAARRLEWCSEVSEERAVGLSLWVPVDALDDLLAERDAIEVDARELAFIKRIAKDEGKTISSWVAEWVPIGKFDEARAQLAEMTRERDDALEHELTQREQKLTAKNSLRVARRTTEAYRDKYEPTKRLAWEDGI